MWPDPAYKKQKDKKMGISFSQAAFLAKAKQDNICFDNILTIGHQTLYLSEKQTKQIANKYKLGGG